MLLVVSNPSCGAGTGHQFVESDVLPLLEKHGQKPDEIIVTNDVAGARTRLLDRVAAGLERQDGDVTIVLSGGDGTVHEVINTLCTAKSPIASTSGVPSGVKHVKIALVPAGTANAMYANYFPPVEGEDMDSPAYKLKSIERLIDGSSPTPLTIAHTVLYGPTSSSPVKSILSTVVTSTALHASILHDSEALRKDIPGMDRFKVAARMNATRWYDASVVFRPSDDGVLMQYDNTADKFVDVGASDKDNFSGPGRLNGRTHELKGPFVYLLSTVNVDRLEPAFEIAPLQRKIPASKRDSMDVVVIRPCKARSRHSAIQDHQTPVSAESRSLLDDIHGKVTPEAFAEVTMAALVAAYQHGAHVALNYGAEGKVSNGGDGDCVVEYIRCGGWEWIPEKSDEAAGLVCSDGTIMRIESGGKAVCKVSSDERHFYVYG